MTLNPYELPPNPNKLPPADDAGSVGTVIAAIVASAIVLGLAWYADSDPGTRVAEGPPAVERSAPETTGSGIAPEAPRRY